MLQGQSLQGVLTAKELHVFLKSRGLLDSYPLFTSVYRIAYEGLKPEEVRRLPSHARRRSLTFGFLQITNHI